MALHGIPLTALLFLVAGALVGPAEGAQPSSSRPTTNVAMPHVKQLRPAFATCVARAGGATWPTQDCIAAEYEFQDARLNHDYRRLMTALRGHDRADLRDRQRAWIKERDAACPWNDDTQGQGHRLDSNYCAMERTARRASELERMLRSTATR